MIRAASWLFTLLAGGTLAGLVALFIWQSLPVWQQEGGQFVLGQRWFYRTHQFGALPMIYGSLVVAAVALLLATPVGLGAAIFTAEYAPPALRQGMKILIELLVGVPSVVYGLLGILLLRNWVYDSLPSFDLLSGDTLLTGGLLLAVMTLPTIVTLADDALRSVPAAQRAAARGLGLTRAEVVLAIALPQARRGLGAAVLLGFGRAVGETIAIFLVVGRQDNFLTAPWYSLRPLVESGQTLTSKLGGAETNIAYGDPLHWAAIMGLGLLLLLLTGGLSVLALGWRKSGHA